ncbi:hypothetical protein DFP72DRAFT_1075127 [Ephemerocybe angulata]|uniref:Uncharacterized protein n=1 Tax=Ephemerocybe angulata TaxID=980116 RepID=A0A8H6LYM0_9AGAR|nr:hypothetical protein DFP72DRAFT_1075127 [Tulosesus angulatus]
MSKILTENIKVSNVGGNKRSRSPSPDKTLVKRFKPVAEDIAFIPLIAEPEQETPGETTVADADEGVLSFEELEERGRVQDKDAVKGASHTTTAIRSPDDKVLTTKATRQRKNKKPLERKQELLATVGVLLVHGSHRHVICIPCGYRAICLEYRGEYYASYYEKHCRDSGHRANYQKWVKADGHLKRKEDEPRFMARFEKQVWSNEKGKPRMLRNKYKIVRMSDEEVDLYPSPNEGASELIASGLGRGLTCNEAISVSPGNDSTQTAVEVRHDGADFQSATLVESFIDSDKVDSNKEESACEDPCRIISHPTSPRPVVLVDENIGNNGPDTEYEQGGWITQSQELNMSDDTGYSSPESQMSDFELEEGQIAEEDIIQGTQHFGSPTVEPTDTSSKLTLTGGEEVKSAKQIVSECDPASPKASAGDEVVRLTEKERDAIFGLLKVADMESPSVMLN